MAKTRKKRRINGGDEQEALERALRNQSEANYPTIVEGFVAMGIPPADIRPRENVFTYHAWRAKDRQVLRGQHGVQITTMLEKLERDPTTGVVTKRMIPRRVTVFHETQTAPRDAAPTPGPTPAPYGAPPTPGPTPGPTPAPRSRLSGVIVERFRRAAESADKRAKELSRPFTQNPTPKRLAYLSQRLHDAKNQRRHRDALLILADLHERGTCPELLRLYVWPMDVYHAVTLKSDSVSQGYHPLTRTLSECHATTPEAVMLQGLIDGKAPDSTTDVQLEESRLALAGIPGFFPTPPALAEMVVRQARIRPGDEVLEPSAGSGAIARQVRLLHPSAELVCIEVSPPLHALLKTQGFDAHNRDCLAASGQVDRIVMNPPFERGQDIDHVLHCWTMLKPGGRMVAVMSAGVMQRSDRKATAFREWLDKYRHSVEPLHEAFASPDALRKTSVSTVLVSIDKEAVQ